MPYAAASRTLRIIVATALGWHACPVLAAAQEPAEAPLIVFDRSHPLVPDDGEAMVQVFASGRLVVVRGPERRFPGRCEFQFDVARFARIAALVTNAASANPPFVARPQREVVEGRVLVTTVSDQVTTSMWLGSPEPEEGAAAVPHIVREVQVQGLAALEGTASRTPAIDALIDLERPLPDVFSLPVRRAKR